MPPKKSQSRQKATTQSQAATAVGSKRSTTKATTKKADNRAVAQLSPIDENPDDSEDFDDFDDYRQWLQRADEKTQEITLSRARKYWELLPEERATAFADAVRTFRDDEDVQTAAGVELRELLQEVSDMELDHERHDRRRMSREAERLYKEVMKALGVWEFATEKVFVRLGAVDTALTGMPKEELQSLLETYQHRLKESIESADGRIRYWTQIFGQLAPDQVWALENIQRFQDSAKDMESDISTAWPSSNPSAVSSSSSSKRKRREDAGESSSKVLRRSRDPDVTHSGSANGGASRSQHRSSRSRAPRHNHEQVSGGGPAGQHVAAPGLQPPQQDTGHQRPTPDRASIGLTYTPLQSPSGLLDPTSHPPPLHTIGEAGPWTERLRTDLSHPSHSPFLSWCRRQFITANYQALEECEALAEAVYTFHRRTLRDHDWENESGMPALPMTPDDLHYFELGFGNGRMWGNFRRLFNMRRNAPLSFLEYCDRNWANDRLYIAKADSIARQILELVKEKGLSHDWENEIDVAVNIPSYETTKDISLEGLNRNGYWNFRGVVGSGGNGRALLYCKYDRAGNILQRVISKESFISRYWNWPASWSGPVANRIPIEAGLHRLFPRNPHIIEYLGFHVNKQLRMVRHYTAFAELGDLSSLYENHERRVNAVDEHGVALPPPSIPVVAIIYIFQAMAAGACLMAHGAVPDDEGRWPRHQPPTWPHNIIHRDIKPLNYFLSSSESSVMWPKLPIVALGDFGNAIDAADPVFAHSVHDMGTFLWSAPEQSPSAPAVYPVSATTNVYQIGLTILNLMHLKAPRVQAKYGIDDRPFPGFPNDALLYPQDLIDIAEDCIHMDPADRPTPVDLYKSIRDLATGYPDVSSKTVPWQLQDIPPNQPLRMSLDKWAV